MVGLNNDGGTVRKQVSGDGKISARTPNGTGGAPVLPKSRVAPPFQFEERFGGIDGFLPLAECERALFLTKQQMVVMEGLAYGMSAVDIGTALGLSSKTIESHTAHIKEALELDTIWDLRMWAVKYFLTLKANRIEVQEVAADRAPKPRRKFLLGHSQKEGAAK